ncbi:hypothetical protein UFOVP858_19 [uncultured Caudovirales phage]|jgi:hypothetical protein|uniref:Uncharacterized protein n=1 Tax=uncultured Caudovirales phage TaxID=2100421 RepID=A0A6J5PBG6_9CAUD|nr:hypothetical protein UFOVP858_19 [uncultured Caudovirales phage]
MSGFPTKERQRIVDEYLQATGRNMFVPGEFVDWLKGQPKHEAYPWFYGMTDGDAARQWRIDLARRMASGLRIVVRDEEPETSTIVVREYPAFVSPVDGRKDGGGYAPFDPRSEIDQAELRRQAAVSLTSWLNRYRGCAENIGVDVSPLEEIAVSLRGVEAV